MNWPNFATSPACLGWPAFNRHTVACKHRLTHILWWPPEPAVWFMSEWRAVAIEQAKTYADLRIVSSSFEMATVVKGSLEQAFEEYCKCTLKSMFLYLIKIPDEVPENKYTLFVSGRDGVKFNQSYSVSVSKKTLSLFIQTDKAMYKPGQTGYLTFVINWHV